MFAGWWLLLRKLVRIGHVHGTTSIADMISSRFGKSAPLAVSQIKRAALRGLDLPLADGIKLERELYKWLQATEDAREGAQAFAQTRPPQWKGR